MFIIWVMIIDYVYVYDFCYNQLFSMFLGIFYLHFCFLSMIICLHSVIWYQVTNTNNFLIVVWFQVFLSNTKNLYTIICIYLQALRTSAMLHKVNFLSEV